MDIRVNDELIMKKPHPCGDNRFLVLRVGMDFRIRCQKCGREVMVPRKKVERNIKKVMRSEDYYRSKPSPRGEGGQFALSKLVG